ncbi:MAG: efflux RND transporter periplasmic adaptor subunit [Verrucomicrobiales bacterium]|nr:efflux RND transporter periplasmic adaptor subunit [Verrucomicrobiales bacterium]
MKHNNQSNIPDSPPPVHESDEGGASLSLRILGWLLPVLIVGAGVVTFLLLYEPRDRLKKPSGASRGLKTRVVELQVEDYTSSVETSGIVRAHNEVTLTSQVPGRIVSIAPQFEDGAFFKKGEVLVQLEEADFAAAVASGEAQLAQASAGYAQEKARAAQARRNWEDLGYEDEPNELVLRLPQLREAEARVGAAKTQLEQARRNLKRASVVAPFDGRVRQRLAGISQAVNGGTPLGKIFAVDFAEVRLPISSVDMGFLELPEDRDDPPVEVTLSDAIDESNQTRWKAEVVRTEGALDQNSLELFAIARISDPFGRKSGMPSLRIGQPVLASVPGKVLEDVIKVPRAAVRQLKRIYVVDKVNFTIRGINVVPIRGDEEYLIIREESISDGDFLATTPMAYVPNGAWVEIIPDEDEVDPSTKAADESGTELVKPSS